MCTLHVLLLFVWVWRSEKIAKPQSCRLRRANMTWEMFVSFVKFFFPQISNIFYQQTLGIPIILTHSSTLFLFLLVVLFCNYWAFYICIWGKTTNTYLLFDFFWHSSIFLPPRKKDVYMPKKEFIDDEKSSCIFHNFDDRFLQISSYWLYFDDRLEYFNMMQFTKSSTITCCGWPTDHEDGYCWLMI